MPDHCFISYSVADGLDFATRLFNELEGGHPHIDAWLDKNRLRPGNDWDEQIAKAIRDCKCLVFAMSPDSIAEGSTCKHEWVWALKYKKPVVPLLIDRKAQLPFRMGSRQYIDFTSNFEAGLARLRKHMAYLDSDEGKLDELRHRLEDANRDLRRAKDEDKPRVQTDIDELKKQIETQQKIVDNPKGAEEQTKKNIEAGLERERIPEKPTAKETSTKFINPLPGVAPNYFQDRLVETQQIIDFLNDEAQRLMTIVGRGGVGKTAMVCRLLKGLEGGKLPDGLGTIKVNGIVYLSESGSHRVNFVNIYHDLCKLLPSDKAQELDSIYKNPEHSLESKMHALFEKFGKGRVVLLLDNFEPLVDMETFAIRDADLDEALRVFLNGAHTAVNIIITTRVAPREVNLIQPGRQRVLTLDKGLESPYAENILREMDSDGQLGLKSATAEALNSARMKTRGFPRALEALFAILASDRYTMLEELLAMPLPENVVESLVGEAFNRLDANAQKVMQALAVYNRPVTPAALDYLLAPHIPTVDSAPILRRLAIMHFTRKESGRFYLHPADREFAFSLIPNPSPAGRRESSAPNLPPLRLGEGKVRESDAFTQHDLTSRAADYFAQARKPRTEWKKLDDLSAQLTEFDLRCEVGDYNTAAKILVDIFDDHLLVWGHHYLLISKYEKIQEKITDLNLKVTSNGNLAWLFSCIGQVHKAIKYYEEALQAARAINNPEKPVSSLANLGTAYFKLGDGKRAVEYYEQAIQIVKKTGNRKIEGQILGNLGNYYASTGDEYKAIGFYKSALNIARETGDREGEGRHLGNLGNRYDDLNDIPTALQYYELSLKIRRELNHLDGEAIDLVNIAGTLVALVNYKKALDYYQLAIGIADKISVAALQNYARWGLSQLFLFQNDLSNANTVIEAALQYDAPQYNHNASTLHGIIALRQGDEVAARGAFVRAIGQADEILSKTAEYYSALDAKGLALCGLALCGRDTIYRIPTDAIETFRKARKIAPHAGIVKSVLRLFDELVKCDTEGILKDVRKAVEGKE